jgi:hypothetical protein
MKKTGILLLSLLALVWNGCDKDLNITDFKDDFGNYQPELKIEGLLQQDRPQDSIVRIIRTSAVTDVTIFNGKDDDGDGDIDEYDETLPLMQDTTATVRVKNLNSGDIIEFEYVAQADSFLTWEDEDDWNGEGIPTSYGGYKPKEKNIQLESYDQYQLEIHSKEFDKIITAITSIYPPVEMMEINQNYEDDVLVLKPDDSKEIFWKSDLDVTAYYITYEEMTGMNNENSEHIFSRSSSRDRDLTENYKDFSVGKDIIFGIGSGTILRLTIEALSPDYGNYMFSELPLNDPQKSNLRDQDGNAVMGCFGAVAAKSVYIVIEE